MKARSARLLVCMSIALLCACNRTPHAAATAAEPAPEEARPGVTLKPEEAAKLGIVTSPAATIEYAAEVAGYGVVLTHDVIAQAVADVATADAARQQSRAALARVKNLSGTPGAFSAETEESTQRQAAADEAALILAQRKLSATFGQTPLWHDRDRVAVVNEVASGTIKLVRATFPLGTLTGPVPARLRISRSDPAGKGESWQSDVVWAAPADSTIPGRSLFALLKQGDVGEGERLDVSVASGKSEPGLLAPQSAIVISDASYWCFVESEPGYFVRVPVDTSRPVTGGYFVTSGMDAGAKIVTAGAGLLLARETNPSTEAE